MKEITWKTETRKVADLIPADYNPRVISEKQRHDLTASLEKFGLAMPVVINRNNNLIGGHQRVKIYADLGRPEISVSVPDRELTAEEEVELNLRLNKNGGEFDFAKLESMGVDVLKEVGFGSAELGRIFDGETFDDGFEEEKAIETAKKTSLQEGDVMILGDHRLMIGDSTDEADVKRLMGGAIASMIYCDPPYNIGLDYAKGLNSKRNKYQGQADTTVDDDRTPESYAEFCEATIANAVSVASDNAHVFYWCDERWIWLFQQAYSKLGIENKRVCLWIKNSQMATPSVAFNKVYEPCVYGVIGKPYLNPDFRNAHEVLNREISTGNALIEEMMGMFSVWLASRDPNMKYDHPTQKPIKLHEKPLKRCSAPGDAVIDLFGGSGSTLIACEQMKRRAFLMEKNPIFGQVIVDRWEKLTGNKAVKM